MLRVFDIDHKESGMCVLMLDPSFLIWKLMLHDACLSLIVMMSFGFNLNLHSYFTLINERSFNKVLSLFGTLWLFHLYIEIQMHFNC